MRLHCTVVMPHTTCQELNISGTWLDVVTVVLLLLCLTQLVKIGTSLIHGEMC